MKEKVFEIAAIESKKSQIGHDMEEFFGVNANNTTALLAAISGGFPSTALEKIREALGISLEVLAPTIGISPRTLTRRMKAKTKLSTTESDRLVSLARIISAADELFEGNRASARRWLNKPNRALGNISPLRMAETETGRREVEDLIARLEHGVFC